MKPLFSIIIVFVFALNFTASVSSAAENELTVFAAASTTGPLLEAAKAYKSKTGVAVRFSFASSGTLARQIEQGAKADIFISASKKWGDYASEKGLLVEDTKRQFLTNTLVLIAPKGKEVPKISFSENFDLSRVFAGKMSIGNPAHVPAGRYAKEALTNLKWWDSLKSRLILSKDVRAALRVIEVGEAELGIVYGSDAGTSEKVVIAGVFPASSHKPIIYVIGKCKGGAEKSEDFIKFLSTPEVSAIFKNFGFIPKP